MILFRKENKEKQSIDAVIFTSHQSKNSILYLEIIFGASLGVDFLARSEAVCFLRILSFCIFIPPPVLH